MNKQGVRFKRFLHSSFRSYRVTEWRKRSMVVLFAGSMILWGAWLLSRWQSVTVIVAFGLLTMALMVENFLVNVKIREEDGQELNPIWVRIGKHIPFKYAFPLVIGIITIPTILMFGLQGTSLIYAPVFPVALICSVNDALVLWAAQESKKKGRGLLEMSDTIQDEPPVRKCPMCDGRQDQPSWFLFKPAITTESVCHNAGSKNCLLCREPECNLSGMDFPKECLPMRAHVAVFKAGRYEPILDDPWTLREPKETSSEQDTRDRRVGAVMRTYLERGDSIIITKVTEETE